MTYYLSMDGVDDYIRTPSITFTKVVLDMSAIRQTNYTKMYVDARLGIGFGYFQSNTNGTDAWSTFNRIYVDDVQKTNNTTMVPNDTRCVVRIEKDTTGTDDVNIFSTYSASSNSFMQGKIYDIKFYNGATLVAHYDMSTQTVQDQSGNGNHATLTGGAWVDDGAGGTPVTVNSIVATNTVSMSSPTVTTTSSVVINSVSSQLVASVTNPTIDTQRQVTLLSSVSTFNIQAIPPSIIAESPNVSISSAVSSVSLNAVSPIISIDNNVVSVVLNAMISANAPIIEILNDVDYFEKVIRRTLSITTKYKTDLNVNRSYKSTLDI